LERDFYCFLDGEYPLSTINTEPTTTKYDAISDITDDGNRVWSFESSLIEVDAVSRVELKENGFRTMLRTKIVYRIGSSSY